MQQPQMDPVEAPSSNDSSSNDLPVLHRKATGIDVGSERMFVSVGGDRPESFGTTTVELERLAEYLHAQEVSSVALEATGIYWLCLYEVLERQGLEILVVNGRHAKNLPGRKSDVSDSQWLATMHSRGLLRSGFVPSHEIRRLQDYVRLRQDHIGQAASQIQLMQKALERMNVKVHTVISKLNGMSGLRMMRAIVAGEREPQRLVQLCSLQILGKKREALLEALQGNWKAEHLFALRQALETWDFFQVKIQECDGAIEELLKEMAAKAPSEDEDSHSSGSGSSGSGSSGSGSSGSGSSGSGPHPSEESRRMGAKVAKPKRAQGNAPQIVQLHELLLRISGDKDVSAIPGIADQTWLQLIGEVGCDLRAFKTEKHFTSWLGLAPAGAQSGKRSRSVRRGTNRAGRLFCVVAQSVARSVDKALGGFYRRLKARRGAPIANKALARKMAVMFWRIMVQGINYVEVGLQAYEQKARESQIQSLKKIAFKLDMSVVPIHNAETSVNG